MTRQSSIGNVRLAMWGVWAIMLALSGCNTEKVGYGPDEYDPYAGRDPRATHKGGDVKPMVVAIDRSQDRQKEILGHMQRFYEGVFSKDNIVVQDNQSWINRFLNEHRGVAPDPATAVTSALADLKSARDRLTARRLESSEPEAQKLIDRHIARVDKDIEVFTKYVAELPTLTPEYKRRTELVKAAQERLPGWDKLFSRTNNTLVFVKEGGNGNVEINRAFPEAVELLDHKEDFVKIETINFVAAVGGVEAKFYAPRIKALAASPAVSEPVRQAATQAVEAIAAANR